MLRTLALTTLTLLALDGVSTVLAPTTGVSLTGEAAAADFTGKIKRIKIKKRRVGSGFKVVAKTGGDDADSVASAELTLSNASTGEIIEEVVLDDGLRGKQVFTGRVPALAGGGGGTITISFQTADMVDYNGDPFGEQQEFEVSVDGLDARTAEDTTSDGWKVRTSINPLGELTVVLGNEDKSWGGGGTVDVTVSVDEGPPTELALDEVRQRFARNLTADILFEDIVDQLENVEVQAKLKDADGNVVDSLVQTVSLVPETATPGLSKASLKQTKGGAAKLVSWTESDGQAAALEVDLVDNATGESVLMTTDDTPMQTIRSYQYDLIEFDPGEAPGGYVYLVLIDLIDESGDPVGEQIEVELTVPTYDAEADTDGTDWEIFSDASGQQLGVVGFYATADGQALALSYGGEDAAQVASTNLIFEEPYEGPAPLETEVNVSLRGQLDKWIQKGDAGVPEDYTLTTSLVTPEGEVLDSSTATGGGTGTVYRAAGNGSGTRKAASQAQQSHIALL